MIRRVHIVKRLGSSSAQRAFKLISFSPKSTGHALEDDIIYNELRVFKNGASNFLKIKYIKKKLKFSFCLKMKKNVDYNLLFDIEKSLY